MARFVVTALTIALLAIPLVGSSATVAAPRCDGLKATIIGTDKADVLKGGPRRDVIVAKGGNDRILGRGGKDVICAGKGKDVIKGGDGNDRIWGGDKNDVIRGGAGWDRVNGGGGIDACYLNADGGKKIRCEDGDLRVVVIAPDKVLGRKKDDKWIIEVRARNIGATPLADVEVELEYGELQVSCRKKNPSGTYPMDTLAGGERSDIVMQLECDAPSGAKGLVTLMATGTSSTAEPNLANNVDESQTVVRKP